MRLTNPTANNHDSDTKSRETETEIICSWLKSNIVVHSWKLKISSWDIISKIKYYYKRRGLNNKTEKLIKEINLMQARLAFWVKRVFRLFFLGLHFFLYIRKRRNLDSVGRMATLHFLRVSYFFWTWVLRDGVDPSSLNNQDKVVAIIMCSSAIEILGRRSRMKSC